MQSNKYVATFVNQDTKLYDIFMFQTSGDPFEYFWNLKTSDEFADLRIYSMIEYKAKH